VSRGGLASLAALTLVAVSAITQTSGASVAAPRVQGGVVFSDPSGIFRPGLAKYPTEPEFEKGSVSVYGDRVLTVRFLGGSKGCWSLDTAIIQYDADRIIVTLYGGYHALLADLACPREGVLYPLSILLDESVAGRQLVRLDLLGPRPSLPSKLS
jgi:hypothetical protein